MEKEKPFEELKGISMVGPSILETAVYRILKDNWLKETTVGPESCCDIFLQLCYKSNELKLKTLQYDQKILDRCYKENHGYIQKNLMFDSERF